MARSTSARSSQPRVKPAIDTYQRQQRSRRYLRLLPVGLTVLVVLVPFLWRLIPDTVWIFPIRKQLAVFERLVSVRIPGGTAWGLPLYAIVRLGLGGFWLIQLALLLKMWRRIRLQFLLPYTSLPKANYYRIRVPRRFDVAEQEKGTEIMGNLAQRLPRPNPMKPTATPVVLRWTGIPKQAVQQGIVIAGDAAFMDATRRYIKTLGTGVEVFSHPDPFLTAIGRERAPDEPPLTMCWADLTLSLDASYPISIGKESLFLASLIEALTTPPNVILTDVHIMLVGGQDAKSQQKARYLREALKDQLERAEVSMMTQKISKPSLRMALRLVVVADDAGAGSSALSTMISALTSVRQPFGMQEQGFRATPIQQQVLMPAIPAPFPRWLAWLWRLIILGGMVWTAWIAWMAWTTSGSLWRVSLPIVIWACVPLARLGYERLTNLAADAAFRRVLLFLPPIRVD